MRARTHTHTHTHTHTSTHTHTRARKGSHVHTYVQIYIQIYTLVRTHAIQSPEQHERRCRQLVKLCGLGPGRWLWNWWLNSLIESGTEEYLNRFEFALWDSDPGKQLVFWMKDVWASEQIFFACLFLSFLALNLPTVGYLRHGPFIVLLSIPSKLKKSSLATKFHLHPWHQYCFFTSGPQPRCHPWSNTHLQKAHFKHLQNSLFRTQKNQLNLSLSLCWCHKTLMCFFKA